MRFHQFDNPDCLGAGSADGPEIQINPLIVVSAKPGAAFSLSTVEQVIDYVRRHGAQQNWDELRDAAFVAAAVPSDENLAILREHAARAFKALL